MFKIGEFSKLVQVSVRMLRYYDEVDLLKPALIDPESKYRLYTSSQIEILRKIVFLKDLGFSVEETKGLLAEWNKDIVAEKLRLKEEEIKWQIKREEERLQAIHHAIKAVGEKQIDIEAQIVVKAIPSYRVLSLRRIVPNYFYEEQLWGEFQEYVAKKQLPIEEASSTFSIYHDAEYKEENVDIELCVVTSVKGEVEGDFCFREVEGIEEMACFMVYGPYENIRPTYLLFANWLETHHDYMIKGGDRQICHKGPWNEEDPKDYVTEIQIPIYKAIDSHNV